MNQDKLKEEKYYAGSRAQTADSQRLPQKVKSRGMWSLKGHILFSTLSPEKRACSFES